MALARREVWNWHIPSTSGWEDVNSAPFCSPWLCPSALTRPPNCNKGPLQGPDKRDKGMVPWRYWSPLPSTERGSEPHVEKLREDRGWSGPILTAGSSRQLCETSSLPIQCCYYPGDITILHQNSQHGTAYLHFLLHWGPQARSKISTADFIFEFWHHSHSISSYKGDHVSHLIPVAYNSWQQSLQQSSWPALHSPELKITHRKNNPYPAPLFHFNPFLKNVKNFHRTLTPLFNISPSFKMPRLGTKCH